MPMLAKRSADTAPEMTPAAKVPHSEPTLVTTPGPTTTDADDEAQLQETPMQETPMQETPAPPEGDEGDDGAPPERDIGETETKVLQVHGDLENRIMQWLNNVGSTVAQQVQQTLLARLQQRFERFTELRDTAAQVDIQRAWNEQTGHMVQAQSQAAMLGSALPNGAAPLHHAEASLPGDDDGADASSVTQPPAEFMDASVANDDDDDDDDDEEEESADAGGGEDAAHTAPIMALDAAVPAPSHNSPPLAAPQPGLLRVSTETAPTYTPTLVPALARAPAPMPPGDDVAAPLSVAGTTSIAPMRVATRRTIGQQALPLGQGNKR